MTTEQLPAGEGADDQNEPAYWSRRIDELKIQLDEARADEASARGASAHHQLIAGSGDQTLLGALARASAHVSSVEAAIDMAKVKRDEAALYQVRQQCAAVEAEANQHADAFISGAKELEQIIAQFVGCYQRTFAAGHSLGVCIGKGRQLVPADRRRDARVHAGDAREGLGYPAHFVDRLQIEIARRLGGNRWWPSCPDVPAGRMNTTLTEAHQHLADTALAELAAYLNLEE